MKPINTIANLLTYRKYILLILLLFGMATITACSGGSTTTVSGVDGSGSSTVLTGVFIDAPVGGLNYQTATMNGLTDENGTFMYHEGETVTFMIGDIMLGSAPGGDIMTPLDLVPGAADETDPTVTNICRLLQSIDWDGDLTNGIMITDTIRSEMSGRMINVTKSIAEFNDYDVQAFFDTMHILGGFSVDGQRSLRSSVEAQDHFRQSLMGNMGDMQPGDPFYGPGQPGTGMGGMPQGSADSPGNSQGNGYTNPMNNSSVNSY